MPAKDKKYVSTAEIVVGQVEHKPGFAKPGKTFMPGQIIEGVKPAKLDQLIAQGLAREYVAPESDLIDEPAKEPPKG
jgi:hypothetical protein